MVLDVTPIDRGLTWFDPPTVLWQSAWATGLLCGTVGGAFILACKCTALDQIPGESSSIQVSHLLLALIAGRPDTWASLSSQWPYFPLRPCGGSGLCWFRTCVGFSL